jgi:hypothetical protein
LGGEVKANYISDEPKAQAWKMIYEFNKFVFSGARS